MFLDFSLLKHVTCIELFRFKETSFADTPFSAFLIDPNNSQKFDNFVNIQLLTKK